MSACRPNEKSRYKSPYLTIPIKFKTIATELRTIANLLDQARKKKSPVQIITGNKIKNPAVIISGRTILMLSTG